MKLVLSVRMGEQIRFPVQRAFFFRLETLGVKEWEVQWPSGGKHLGYPDGRSCEMYAAGLGLHRRENWGMDSRKGVQRRSAAAHPCGRRERMTLTHSVLYVNPWLFQAGIEAEHHRKDHVTARGLASWWSGRREKGQERGRFHSLRIPFRAAPPLSLLLKVLLLSYRTGWWLRL